MHVSLFLFLFYFLLRHISMTLPASFRGKNTTRPDYEHQNSNLYAISGQKKNVTVFSTPGCDVLKGKKKVCLLLFIPTSHSKNKKETVTVAWSTSAKTCWLVRICIFRFFKEQIFDIFWCLTVAFSAMDGVPFMISEKFACASSDVSCLDWVFGLDMLYTP